MYNQLYDIIYSRLYKSGGVILENEISIGEESTKVEIEGKIDEEIALKAKLGDIRAQEYLINKYKNFVKAKAKSYFLVGADKEDIYQEGMIGLYKAIRDFRTDKLASFKAFAELCITRQIITAIKTATRQKHIPLNTYVSLNKPIYDEESDRTLLDILSTVKISDPEELVISREEVTSMESEIEGALSELELEVLNSYLQGKSYQEIACDLDRHSKSIDNALQRVKRKLERCLNKNTKNC
jgi:RNA polymerase sporulation-specific sigma factor